MCCCCCCAGGMHELGGGRPHQPACSYHQAAASGGHSATPGALRGGRLPGDFSFACIALPVRTVCDCLCRCRCLHCRRRCQHISSAIASRRRLKTASFAEYKFDRLLYQKELAPDCARALRSKKGCYSNKLVGMGCRPSRYHGSQCVSLCIRMYGRHKPTVLLFWLQLELPSCSSACSSAAMPCSVDTSLAWQHIQPT